MAIVGRFSALYINRSLTKMFPIVRLLEMIGSSIKRLGEVEYDNQNCLQYQRISVFRKIRSEVHHILSLHINRSITKIFPIETVVEKIDSSVRNLGEVESVISRSVLIRNFFVMDRFIYSGNSM